ncbi:hypothetical protein CCH79_00011237, partial [Gambusia affinis]
ACRNPRNSSGLFPVTQLPPGPSDPRTRRQRASPWTPDSSSSSSPRLCSDRFNAVVAFSHHRSLLGRLFGIDCGNVSGRLVNQIQTWQVKGSCLDEGEKITPTFSPQHLKAFGFDCRYENVQTGLTAALCCQLVSTAPYLIKATHTSPRTKTLNVLQFLLEQSTICRVTGEATSEGSKDPAGNATNFCSLQNLVNGSKLTDAAGYKQFSNKWICPGFDSAVCSFS